jgi:hypothetical protein
MEMTLAEAVLAGTLSHTQTAKHSKQVHSKQQFLVNRFVIKTVLHATRCDIPVAQIYHHQDRSEAFEVTTLTAVNGEGSGERFVKRIMDSMPMLPLRRRIAASFRCGLNQSFDFEINDGRAFVPGVAAINVRLLSA